MPVHQSIHRGGEFFSNMTRIVALNAQFFRYGHIRDKMLIWLRQKTEFSIQNLDLQFVVFE